MKPRTLYDKMWDDHVVDQQAGRHLPARISTAISSTRSPRRRPSKVCAPPAARSARRRRRCWSSTTTCRPRTARSRNPDPESADQIASLAENARDFGLEYYDEFDKRQGICHIIGPEQGFTLPGTTIVCGDSHTATHGAFGALAYGIGTSEVEHVLATQTLIQKKSKNMRAVVDGKLPDERDRQGHHPGDHRRDRHRGRHRLRAGICRRGDPFASRWKAA